MTPDRIIKLRKALGVTQRELAAQIGTFQVTVARWETGKSNPKGANLKALSQLSEKARKQQTLRREQTGR